MALQGLALALQGLAEQGLALALHGLAEQGLALALHGLAEQGLALTEVCAFWGFAAIAGAVAAARPPTTAIIAARLSEVFIE